MKENDLISVIVPVYNVEKYLDYCINSIINQTYNNLEILLVDDGSTDQSSAICDKWAVEDKRIKVIHKENGGLSDARNAGMQRAKGTYVAFIDSDDWIEKYYIEYLYRAIKETGAEISACEIRQVIDGQKPEKLNNEVLSKTTCTTEEALYTILKGDGFRAIACNKLYKAELLREEKFKVGVLHEDEFFTYRIIGKAKTLSFVKNQLYNYRQREGSIMKTTSMRHLDVLDAYLDRLNYLSLKFPELYKRDKVAFCITCVNYYCYATMKKFEDNNKSKSIINEKRKGIKFTVYELLQYSLREKIYVIGSNKLLIGLFSRIRVFMMRRHNYYE